MKQIIHDILYVVGIAVLATLLFGGPLMLLWNWLMPIIFNLPQITFWQACGLQLMAVLIFKSNIKIDKDK